MSYIWSKVYIRLQVNCRLFLSDFNDTWNFSIYFRKKIPDINFHENSSSGSRVVPCRRTDRRTDMTKLIVAFRNVANAPTNGSTAHRGRRSRVSYIPTRTQYRSRFPYEGEVSCHMFLVTNCPHLETHIPWWWRHIYLDDGDTYTLMMETYTLMMETYTLMMETYTLMMETHIPWLWRHIYLDDGDTYTLIMETHIPWWWRHVTTLLSVVTRKTTIRTFTTMKILHLVQVFH